MGANLAALAFHALGRSDGEGPRGAADAPPARPPAARRADRVRGVRRQPLPRARRCWPRDACTRKASTRFDAPALAALSRVFAREAALKVAEQGLRLVRRQPPNKAPGDIEIQALRGGAGHAGDPPRAGGPDSPIWIIVADVLYGRTVKPEAHLAEAAAR